MLDLSDEIVGESERLLFRHPLRAGDALHLASALWLKRDLNQEVPLLTGDRALRAAADEEGMAVEYFGPR